MAVPPVAPAPVVLAPMVLALSPHLDDAAFSCGGTLAQLAQAGWRVTVATAFTRSVPDPQGFALACQTDKGLPPDADYMALRRAEDAAAMAVLGAEPRWLDFPEAPHRGYGDARALFGEVRADDTVDAPLAVRFAALLTELRPTLLLAPQGVGGHVDHLLLIRALDRVAGGASILWWRDFPYAARTNAPQPLGARFQALPEWTLDVAALTERRLHGCAAYASQLGFQFGGRARLEERLAEAGPVERFRLSGTPPPGGRTGPGRTGG
jgi:LmbE family N-acetylglucosaminyl deacetylase